MSREPPILGAHMSIAGGYYKAVDAAADLGMQCVQLFTKNNSQWRAKAIMLPEIDQFRESLAATGMRHALAHDSYLINLAAPDDDLWRRSIAAFADEICRAELLGIPYVVTHPGAYTTSDEATGLSRVIQAIDIVHDQLPQAKTQCLLETTAGQGTTIGWKFEQLATILGGVQAPERLGICLDTCHLFAAGYPLVSPAEYRRTMQQLEATIGCHLVRAIHLNDSKQGLGSRVDRHAHIGEGSLGLAPFRHFLNDKRWAQTPMYLETPKGTTGGESWDARNLRVLRGLCAGSKRLPRKVATHPKRRSRRT